MGVEHYAWVGADGHVYRRTEAIVAAGKFGRGDWIRTSDPCAQGKPGSAGEALISERFAACRKSWAQIWAQLSGDALLLVAIDGESTAPFVPGASSWENGRIPNATITVDAALKARLADIAGKTGQSVDEFVEALLRRIAGTDVAFERGVPVFPRRPGAPTLTVEDVDRLAGGSGE